MIETPTLLGERDLDSLLKERRVEDRYHCRIRLLCRQEPEHDGDEAKQTWGVAHVVDISQHGIGLLVPFRARVGMRIVMVPLISSWRPDWTLTARVTNVRHDLTQGWFAGCEFLEPLPQGQFNIILRNSM